VPQLLPLVAVVLLMVRPPLLPPLPVLLVLLEAVALNPLPHSRTRPLVDAAGC
jgi:hypothetical protein